MSELVSYNEINVKNSIFLGYHWAVAMATIKNYHNTNWIVNWEGSTICVASFKLIYHWLIKLLYFYFDMYISNNTPWGFRVERVNKGDPAAPSNYCPISLTAICCKLMEHIMQSNIMRHLNSHSILNDAQHGFRKNRSCETQLLMVIADIHKALDNNLQMDGILLDFSKAFDKVPHTCLALKLEHYGVRGNNLKWIQSFLSNQTQMVVLNGKQSETIPVTSGVPQGTVLGPLLFLVYINDLPDKVRSRTARLFADDCLLYRNVETPQDIDSLQEDLDALQAWEKDWQMEFNPSKCQTIHFTRKRNPMIQDYTIRDHASTGDWWKRHLSGRQTPCYRIMVTTLQHYIQESWMRKSLSPEKPCQHTSAHQETVLHHPTETNPRICIRCVGSSLPVWHPEAGTNPT